jgi:hypothetical protein
MKEIANALQEAKTLLEQIHSAYSDRQGDISIYPLRKVIKVVNEALAKPLRNCDVGSLDEQITRFNAFCDSHMCRSLTNGCPLVDSRNCRLAWAQMPYEKGATDEQ